MESPATTDHMRKVSPLLRTAFVIALLVAAAFLIHREFDAIVDAIKRIDALYLGLGLIAAVAHVAMSYGGWRVLLSGSPASEPLAARMFFVGQMGKYLPGGIWSFLAIAEYGREAGVSAKHSWATSLLALIASVIAGGALAMAIAPQFLFPALAEQPAIGIAGLAAVLLAVPLGMKALGLITGRMMPDLTLPSPGALYLSVCASIIVWLFGGLNLMMVAVGIGLDPFATGALTFGAIYAAAWIAGFAFFIAPAGIGAREGVMVALLTISMSLPDALVVALISRLLVTLADFLLGGIALAIRPAGQAVQANG